MEGEEKNSSRRRKGKKANLNPGRIHEYDFFVTQDEDEPVGGLTDGQSTKKKGRNKSMTFFLSEQDG
jgi:hypothetical protein